MNHLNSLIQVDCSRMTAGTSIQMDQRMISIVHSRRLEMLPPLISLLRILKEAGEKVLYIGLMESEDTKQILDEIGVESVLYPHHLITFREAPIERIFQKLTSRVLPYLKRRWVWRMLREHGLDLQNDVVWSVEMESAAILGDRALELGCRHIHTFYELGDVVGKDYVGFNYRKFVKGATIVQCEYNRAHIFKAENELGRLPFVLPNKPYPHPRCRNLPISDENVAKIISHWAGKKVFLYQGGIQSDRGDLVQMIESLCIGCPDAIVAVMGKKTSVVSRLETAYTNFSYVPFVRPPHHLEVTSHADVGLAFYEGGRVWGLSPLNPVYCAPNKIYEYAGFGMPILCNDIPGLRYTIGSAKAGICLSNFDMQTVAGAGRDLMSKYTMFAENAKQFFESVDLVSIVNRVLDFARGEQK